MNQLQPFIDIALSQVGVKEEGGNNQGAQIREYQKATWLAPAAWPWCAAFVAWCLWLYLQKNPIFLFQHRQGLNAFRCRDASAFGWIKWAKEKGLYVTDEKEPAKAGDIVVFDFSHIGIVVEDQLPGKNYIETVEGNTNNKGARDSESGDGVWRKTRSTSLVRNYIRLIKQD